MLKPYMQYANDHQRAFEVVEQRRAENLKFDVFLKV